ncbi:ABC transporter permease [uncultured Campylobacter sp.]|uniref:ABC transporter permease n=1 Tax=uncultured Campylobacter sp. TaxID=218934 RepID=UPI0025FCAB48|nr:ABC transporter permease [uncultured Campylobacter sp.]
MKLVSLGRIRAMIAKEFRQILRDRATLAIIAAMPLVLMLLFGYAINSNPRKLPTALVTHDSGEMTRSFLSAMQNTDFFKIVLITQNAEEASALMRGGVAQFIVEFPPGFERDLLKGESPEILLSIDATDPSSSVSASGALETAFKQAYARDGRGADLKIKSDFTLVTHSRYNPQVATNYQIVPGLMGLLLTLMTILLTSIAMTRERERGTMENLLASPIAPFEVMIGKIAPYLIVAYLQAAMILAMARVLFDLPPVPRPGELFIAATLLMVANLGIGFTISTVARNQLQAMQMTYLFFLPSLLLSGFMFPFYGMPAWAQILGEVFPLTHFLRIVRGLWLKEASLADFGLDITAMGGFLIVSATIAMWRYKRTLD